MNKRSATFEAGFEAGRLSALYGRWACEHFDLVAVASVLGGEAGIDPRDPLGQASIAMARATSGWHGHPYHSVLHHAEVACCAMMLATLADVDPRQRGLLLCAALGHDIGFDPAAPRQPFHLEAIAADTTDDIMKASNVGAADRSAIRTLILATEPSARRVLRLLADGNPPGEVPHQIAGLQANASLVELAAILSDADVMPSAGLTPEWSAIECERLSRESGHEVDATAFARFLDGLVGATFISAPGVLMNPNLGRIRAWAEDGAALEASSARP